ncbi:MAG: penicillin-binding protein 1C [Myxococcota bacterium]
MARRPGRARWWIAAAGVAAAAFLAVPVPRFAAPVSDVVVDRDGELLGASIAADGQWRFPPTAAVPPRYAAAVEAFEDRRFRLHPGVDPLAVGRAVVQNLSEGRVVSGASTITMQVVRLSRGNPPRTLGEKLVEAGLAVRLELADSKDEILAAYASHAPFGGNTVGLDAAAFRYFGRSADTLSWGEAATLAVLPNAPALVHPGRGRDALRAKRDRLLDVLAADGALSAEDAALAKAEPLPEAPRPVPRDVPHLLARADGREETTLDAALQRRATDALVRHVARLSATGIHNAAAVIVDVPTGEVRAWVGNVPPTGPDDPHQAYVDVVTAPRSTGSTLKPLLYLAELQDGALLPHELVPDHPVRFGAFAPENADHQYEGAVPAAEALARSRNVPAVFLLRQYGVDRFHGFLSRLGMTTLTRPADDYGLTLALGGAEGTLLDLVTMYRQVAYTVDHPTDPAMAPVHWHGNPAATQPAQALDPGAAWLTVQALLEVNRPGVHAAWRSFGGGRKVAWKTGTSFGFRDGWAIGTTPETAIGVWVGNTDGEGRPALTGILAAAPLLFDLFDLVPATTWFDEPADALVSVEVCAHSGMRAGPDCADTRWEKVPKRGATGPGCTWCELVHCDATCAERVDAGCVAPDAIRTEPWFVLPPNLEQYWVRRHPDHRSLPPVRPGCAGIGTGASSQSLSVVTPRDGAEVYVPIELDGRRGRVVFEAATRDPTEAVYWHLDGRYVGETRDVHQLALAPDPGPHALVVVDREGTRIERRFTVLGRPAGSATR